MLPRRTSKFSGRDETRKYRGEERANSLADFHLDNQIPPLLAATIHCHENWKSLINNADGEPYHREGEREKETIVASFFRDISRRIPSSWGCFLNSWDKSSYLFVDQFWKFRSDYFYRWNICGGSEWSRSVAGNKKGVHPCNGRMRNNDPAMSTVISMIRESLITFQTFACRTRIRAQRWNCIPCAVL